jgi:hypothetical protein
MTADDLFFPFDPRDVLARLLDLTQSCNGEEWVLRFLVKDSTDAEGVEVVARASDSLRCSVGFDSVEAELARHINLVWPAEARLKVLRAHVEQGGEYLFGGDTDAGLYVKLRTPTLA